MHSSVRSPRNFSQSILLSAIFLLVLLRSSFPNDVNVIIPFNEEVMAVGGNPVGNPDGNIGGNSKLEIFVISSVLENNKISANAISKQIGISQRSVERAFAALKEKGILEREGGTRGIWIVKK